MYVAIRDEAKSVFDAMTSRKLAQHKWDWLQILIREANKLGCLTHVFAEIKHTMVTGHNSRNSPYLDAFWIFTYVQVGHSIHRLKGSKIMTDSYECNLKSIFMECMKRAIWYSQRSGCLNSSECGLLLGDFQCIPSQLQTALPHTRCQSHDQLQTALPHKRYKSQKALRPNGLLADTVHLKDTTQRQTHLLVHMQLLVQRQLENELGYKRKQELLCLLNNLKLREGRHRNFLINLANYQSDIAPESSWSA